MPGWQAATGRRMKRPDRRRSNPTPPSDDQPQRRAEDAASDCDPPEGHAVAADWNTFDVHPEQAGYKGERQKGPGMPAPPAVEAAIGPADQPVRGVELGQAAGRERRE